jgi:hypothetical protein
MKHFPLCLFLAVTPALVHAAGEVALKLDLPKPLFLGTPRPIQVPNLEPLTVKQPDLMVPAGTQLLSKDKPVTSSDMFPGHRRPGVSHRRGQKRPGGREC